MSEQSQLLEAVATVTSGLAVSDETSGAIRAALAVLGEALAASCVAIEEFAAEGESPANPEEPRFEWRPLPARTARVRGALPCAPLALPLTVGSQALGHLRIEPGTLRSAWTAAEESAARAAASALAGALREERHRHRFRDTLHGLRAPLTAILAVSDIVRRYGTRLSDEEKAREMEKIQAQVRAMTRLIDESARDRSPRDRPPGR